MLTLPYSYVVAICSLQRNDKTESNHFLSYKKTDLTLV